MRIVKRRVQGIGRQRRGIVFVHLDQRRDQVARIGVGGGEGVGFEFVLARADRGQRREHEGEYRQHQHEQDQRHGVVRWPSSGSTPRPV